MKLKHQSGVAAGFFSFFFTLYRLLAKEPILTPFQIGDIKNKVGRNIQYYVWQNVNYSLGR